MCTQFELQFMAQTAYTPSKPQKCERQNCDVYSKNQYFWCMKPAAECVPNTTCSTALAKKKTKHIHIYTQMHSLSGLPMRTLILKLKI